MKIDELNNELKSMGFNIQDDIYIYDSVKVNTIIVNGRQVGQPVHNTIKMKYFGVGCEVDDSDLDIDNTDFHEFGIINDKGEVVVVFTISDIGELKEYLKEE